MSTASKGSYYERRTKEWLESLGYAVSSAKDRRMTIRQEDGKKPSFQAYSKDVFGCDLVAMNGEHMLWVQVKSNPAHISSAVKTLMEYPWPRSPQIKVWVVLWPHRRRLKEGPEITEVEFEDPS